MDNRNYKIIKEGLAFFHVNEEDYNAVPSKSMSVFYNKKMLLNRDITSLAINAFFNIYKPPSLIVLDSMAASGIGAIRIIKECKNIKKVYINDINPLAFELIKENLRLNDITRNTIDIEITNEDANLLFNEINNKIHSVENEQTPPNVISIDPFGTPNIYLDSAFKAIQKENGLMCVTSTDTAVLFGVRPLSCQRKYLSIPLHTEYCKEIGARILVWFSSKIANINNLGVIPLLTFYSNHFIRVFLLTFKKKKEIHEFFKYQGYILHCKCNYRIVVTDLLKIPDVCPLCGLKDQFKLAGPLWIGDLHDVGFLKEMITINNGTAYPNKKKNERMLFRALEEIGMPPHYYNVHKLSQTLHLSILPKIESIINAIRQQGYLATRTHFDPISIKTTIPYKLLRKTIIEQSYRSE